MCTSAHEKREFSFTADTQIVFKDALTLAYWTEDLLT